MGLRIALGAGCEGGEPFLREALPDADTFRVSEEALDSDLAAADVLVTVKLSREDTKQAKRLRLVQSPGAGIDRIDPNALPPGCFLCSNHAHAFVVAEWIVMAMLAANRRLLRLDRDLRSGIWGQAVQTRDLHDSSLGLVGFGPIGAHVARIAQGFGMTTAAVTRAPSATRARGLNWLGTITDLPRLLLESHFVVLALPLTPATEGLIGEHELDLLGPDGYLINAARGRIVDEKALFAALAQRRIAGAALDVWYQYPESGSQHAFPAAEPFWQLENVLMTPHIGGTSVPGMRARWRFTVEQVRRLEGGQRLANVEAVGLP